MRAERYRNNVPLVGGITLTAMLLGLPLAGIVLSGGDAASYLRFPPRPVVTEHAPFSLPVFVGLAIAGAFVLAVICVPLSRAALRGKPVVPVARFPWFGWAGLLGGAGAWVVAWSRFGWIAPVQIHTFTPLWLAYIFLINGLTYRRTGRCLMTARTPYFVLLFPVSAIFWWFFEYLNRFVSNWHYIGLVTELPPAHYVLYATVPFSTVLPAVLSTQEWLRSFPSFCRAFDRPAETERRVPRYVGVELLLLAGTGLLFIGILPDILFPLVWVSPLLIWVGMQVASGSRSLIDELAAGRWARVVAVALGALVCGLFWELWNMYSQAKWVYSIPFVHVAKVFEMPMLGFFGYLPFGVQCLLVGDATAGLAGSRDAYANEASGSGTPMGVEWNLA